MAASWNIPAQDAIDIMYHVVQNIHILFPQRSGNHDGSGWFSTRHFLFPSIYPSNFPSIYQSYFPSIFLPPFISHVSHQLFSSFFLWHLILLLFSFPSYHFGLTMIPKIILDVPLRVGRMKACCCVETGFRRCTLHRFQVLCNARKRAVLISYFLASSTAHL